MFPHFRGGLKAFNRNIQCPSVHLHGFLHSVSVYDILYSNTPSSFPRDVEGFFSSFLLWTLSVSRCALAVVVPQILFRARWRCMSHLMHGSCEELHLSSSPNTEECQCSVCPCLMALEITPGSSSGWHLCFSPQERGNRNRKVKGSDYHTPCCRKHCWRQNHHIYQSVCSPENHSVLHSAWNFVSLYFVK